MIQPGARVLAAQYARRGIQLQRVAGGIRQRLIHVGEGQLTGVLTVPLGPPQATVVLVADGLAAGLVLVSATVALLTTLFAVTQGPGSGAVGPAYWPLGLVAGAITALILFVADSFPDEVREEKQEP